MGDTFGTGNVKCVHNSDKNHDSTNMLATGVLTETGHKKFLLWPKYMDEWSLLIR
jgi:hypothetical protein